MDATTKDIVKYCKKIFAPLHRHFSIWDYEDGVYAIIPEDEKMFSLNLSRLRNNFQNASFWREDESNTVYFTFNN